MEKFKCLIVDDEIHAVEYLAGLVNAHPELVLVMATANPSEAAAYEEDHPVDIAFVDLEMGEVDGRQLISQFSSDTYSVVCTAYKDQGTSSMHAGSTYFVSKPFGLDDFQKAVNRTIYQIRLERAVPAVSERKESLFFPSEDVTSKINIRLNEVLYFGSRGNNTYVRLKDGRSIELLRSIGFIDKDLTKQGFMRIHRSFIVNITEVERYIRHEQHVLHLMNPGPSFREGAQSENTLPVGRKYKDPVALRLV